MAMSLLRRLFGLSVFASRQSAAPKRQSSHSRRRAFFESLEDRRVLATFSEAGAVLTVTLDSGESLTVVSAGSSYSLTGNNSVDGGITAGRLTGLGNNTVTVTPDGLAAFDTIRIVDGAGNQNTRVTFNNSGANSYSDNFIVELDDDTSISEFEQPSVVFAGASNFGSANLTVSTTRQITINTAQVSVSNGNISMESNVAGNTSGSVTGIAMFNALVTSSGAGNIHLVGRGGTLHGNAGNFGIQMIFGSDVIGGVAGSTTIVEAIGGAYVGPFVHGLYLEGDGTTISSNGGDVHASGSGGSAAQYQSHGVYLSNGGTISAGGTGSVLVEGTGGGTEHSNYGVFLERSLSTITSGGGDVQVVGQGGGSPTGGGNVGVYIAGGLITAGGMGAVSVEGTGGSGTSGNQGVVVTSSPFVADVLKGRILSAGGPVDVTGVGTGESTSGSGYGVLVASAGRIAAGGNGSTTVHGTGGSGTGGDNRGVALVSAGSIITSTDGDVTVVGQGGNSNGIGNQGYGVQVATGATISAGGAGNLSITGTGGQGDINNPGVLIDGIVAASGGSIEISGTGGGGIGHVNGNVNHGIFLQSGQVNAAGSGSVTLNGTGGRSAVASAHGVLLGGTITTGGGDLTVIGQGSLAGGAHFHQGVNVVGTITVGSGGNIQVTGTGGNGTFGSNAGVFVSSVQLSTTDGNVIVTGQGGGAVSTFSNHGVLLQGAGRISAGASGSVTVQGTGGSLGQGNGVQVQDTNSRITSSGGNVHVTGQGGSGGLGSNGVVLFSSGQITAGGSGSVTVTGTGGSLNGVGISNGGGNITSGPGGGTVQIQGQGGGNGTNSNNHGVSITSGQITSGPGGTVSVVGTGGTNGPTFASHGILVQGTAASVVSGGGGVQLTGQPGGGVAPRAIAVLTSGTISSALNGGAITLSGDSMEFATNAVISSGAGAITLKTKTVGSAAAISLGGVDAAGVLGLTDAELDRVTAGTLKIGAADGGAISVVSAITRPASSNLELISSGNVLFNGGSINTAGGGLSLAAGGAVQPNSSGVDATVGVVSFEPGTDLQVAINGPTADTQYTRLNVSGGVNLTGANLLLGGTATLSDGQTFIIVNNDGVDPIAGTFNGLAEGAVIENVLGGVKDAVISYVGGTGNDVVLTVVSSVNAAPTANNDTALANEDGPSITINLTANDTDPNPTDNLQIISVGASAIGLVTINPDGDSITYNPDGQFEFLAAGETDVDTFSYTISDGHGGTSTATVNVTITGENDAPEVAADSSIVVINEGQTATNSGFFFDMDFSDDVTISASQGTIVKSGTSDGSWEWSYVGADDESSTVTITADDGHGGIATTTFDLTVNNQRPASIVVTNRALTGNGSNATFTANVAFADPGDDTWTATIDYGDGTVVHEPIASRTFALNHEYTQSGAYRVTITVADDDGGSVTRLGNSAIAIGTSGSDIIRVRAGSVIIEQNGIEIAHLEDIDDVLVWGGDGDDEISVDPDVTIPAELIGGDGNDSLVAGAGPTVLSGGPGNDELVGGSGPTTVIGGGGENVFVPGTGPSSSGSTSPEAFADSYQVTEDGQLLVSATGVLANDVLGSASVSLIISAVNGLAANVGQPVTTQHGAVTLNPDGSFAYTPGIGCEAATDSFTYTLIDANGATSTATVTISIVKSVADGMTTIDAGGIVRLGGTAGGDLIVLTVLNGKLYRNLDDTGISASSIAEIRVWGRAGNDVITESTGLAVKHFIHGGQGDDLLTGGEMDDVIFGGEGDDILTGLAGHDFLIGGQGRDRIVGSSGHDILVANEIACGLSLADLRAISQAWSSTRTVAADAVDEFLDESTIDDDDADHLTGSSGADLFIINTGDKITDFQFGKPKTNKDGDVVIKDGVMTL